MSRACASRRRPAARPAEAAALAALLAGVLTMGPPAAGQVQSAQTAPPVRSLDAARGAAPMAGMDPRAALAPPEDEAGQGSGMAGMHMGPADGPGVRGPAQGASGPVAADPMTAAAPMGDMGGMGGMTGQLGPYPMSRDASGTSWQPDAAPMEGVMFETAGWTAMAAGYATFLYDHQGGRRGGEKAFSQSMLMVMASRPLGGGELTLRAMGSLDPLMGASGYPLLLQTGEAGNGGRPLVDRQHPHDAVMELGAVYRRPLTTGLQGFFYLAWPGEPAIGPTVYLMRASGAPDPEAPIGHHWLDSTHVSFGVATAGLVAGDLKLEVSQFTGREPNAYRWDLDHPRFDSTAVRATLNPARFLSVQISRAEIKSPESLTPGVDQTRTTASASLALRTPLAGRPGRVDLTLAFGEDRDHPGRTTDAWLLEGVARQGENTLFARAERVSKSDLFADTPQSPLGARVFDVGKLSMGYSRTVSIARPLLGDLGALVSVYDLPSALVPVYGAEPVSFMVFLKLRLSE